jgi:hypothetical protein
VKKNKFVYSKVKTTCPKESLEAEPFCVSQIHWFLFLFFLNILAVDSERVLQTVALDSTSFKKQKLGVGNLLKKLRNLLVWKSASCFFVFVKRN